MEKEKFGHISCKFNRKEVKDHGKGGASSEGIAERGVMVCS